MTRTPSLGSSALRTYGSTGNTPRSSPPRMSSPAPPDLPNSRRLSRWSQASEQLIHSHQPTFSVLPRDEIVDPDASRRSSIDGLLKSPTDRKPSEAMSARAAMRSKPYGVQKMEAISAGLRTRGHFFVYVGIYLITIAQSLEANISPVLEPYFLSSFHAHALLSSMSILTNLAFALGRPPMAKILDFFGRAEAVAASAFMYGLGFILTAISQDVVVFAISKTLSSFGGTGLQLCVTVLIADTTTLTNRALVSSTIAIPWLLTIWIGPVLAAYALSYGNVGIRFVYFFFGLFVPAVSIPLIVVLSQTYHRVAHALLRKMSRSEGGLSLESADSIQYMKDILQQHKEFEEQQSISSRAKQAWEQIDAPGIALLTLAGVFILLPLSIGATRAQSWKDPLIYLFVMLGIIFAWLFRRHERQASYPFISERLLYNQTVRAGCFLGLFHFVCQFVYESYFTSWLQVARFNSARDAQYISQGYLFAACISSLLGGVAAKASSRYRIWGLAGVLIHMVGAVLMVRFRRIENPTWEIVLSQVIGGLGGGLTTMAQLGIQAAVSHQDLAMVTAIYLTITQVGAAVGGSIAGAIWTSMLPFKLAKYLPSTEQDKIPDIMGSLVVALSYARETVERTAINLAYSDTQWLLQVVALLALLPAFVSMYKMQDIKLSNTSPEAVVVLGRASVLLDEESSDDETESASLLDRDPSTSSPVAP